MSEDCIFCQILKGEIPSDQVYADEHTYAFRDINPVAPTHVLVIPREHVASLDDTNDEDAEMLGRLLVTARKVAEQEGLPNGYRVLTNTGPDSGQVVFHLHLHVLGGKKLVGIG